MKDKNEISSLISTKSGNGDKINGKISEILDKGVDHGMKKLLRGLVCGAVLSLFLCTAAFAAGNGIRIELNGENVVFQDAAPQIVNDRTYLPFRAVFVALGFADENITFHGESRTVEAVSDGLTVSMVIGEKKVTVVKNGVTTVLTTDVPAFIDPQLGRTYVPVSFVAQAVGYRVGWDGSRRTVILEDLEALFENNAQTYQVLEKYLAYSSALRSSRYQVEGTVTAWLDGKESELEAQGGFTMIMDGGMNFDMNTRMALNGMLGAVDLAAAIPEGVQLEMRGNMMDGTISFRSEELSVLSENGAPVWYTQEQDGMEENVVLAVLDRQPEEGAVRDYVEKLIREAIRENNALSATDQLKWFNQVLADTAFVRMGSQYVSGVQEEVTGISVSFYSEGNRMFGYRVIYDQDGFHMDISLIHNTLQAVYRMENQQGERITLRLEGEMTPTEQRPVGKPAAGDRVLKLQN